jgi:RNA methyltransferase, TrmH family
LHITPITSVKNATIKKVMSLNKKRGRQEHMQFVVEGIREINMAIESGLQPIDIMFNKHWDAATLSDFIAGLDGANKYELDDIVFEKISYRDSVANAVATFPLFETSLSKLNLQQDSLVVVLESIEKPGNLGAIFRTADAAGVDAIIISNANTDFYNPNVIRASLGAVFTVPFAIATNDDTLSFLTERDFMIYSTYLEGSIAHHKVGMTKNTALVMGSEAHGISPFWVENNTSCIKIPMRGKADSMNVSTAAAVVIYEAVRQRTS